MVNGNLTVISSSLVIKPTIKLHTNLKIVRTQSLVIDALLMALLELETSWTDKRLFIKPLHKDVIF